jgi:hypothetical protein
MTRPERRTAVHAAIVMGADRSALAEPGVTEAERRAAVRAPAVIGSGCCVATHALATTRPG